MTRLYTSHDFDQVESPDRERSGTVAVIGAGPAGLTSAYELLRCNSSYRPVVYEAGNVVGGISRTEQHLGFRFDIGGHRFFTKVAEVESMWHEVLGNDFITVPRLSRIFYRGSFYDYPLKLTNALYNLGPYESARIIASYLKWRLFPHATEETFRQWVMNRFGGRLYMHFFRPYTEKVWGIPAGEIRADWAAQRIKDLSLMKAVANAFGTRTNATSLIEKFQYPRLGPGMMWEAVADRIRDGGGILHTRSAVTKVRYDGTRVTSIDVCRWSKGAEAPTEETVSADHFINSMALRDLLECMTPRPPDDVMAAARCLRYRDFLIVTLILDHPDPFPDNWIYIHSPEVKVGRIQNFRAWSADMVPDRDRASIGMEYFCNVDEPLWKTSDDSLIKMAARELEELGLAKQDSVIDGKVIRQPKAYPVYDSEYRDALDTISAWLKRFENLQTIGRNGLHRYNNQDHSMLTGMLAARNIVGEDHDVWSVNVERSYHEEMQIKSPLSKAA